MTGAGGLARRAVVEGFYGPPWTHDERLGFLAFAGRVGLTEYVHAPKDDLLHRERWQDPYPQEDLERIGDLARAAAAHGVVFTSAISPGLSMCFTDDEHHRALARKCAQVLAVGVRSFALLFDDVPTTLQHEADRTAFGDDEHATGRAHGAVAARFVEEFTGPAGIDGPLLVCPTDYAGTAHSPYRDGFAETLPRDAQVLWTGPDIVVGALTRDDVDRAAASYRRPLVLWDNFPVNDFDRSRVFLGPLRGRPTDVAGSALVGVCANPMVEAGPSRFALATVADWAADPERYDPDAAAARALHLVAGPDADDLAPLVEACSSWPPSAPQSTRLEALCAAALDGDRGATEELRRTLGALAAVGSSADPDPAGQPLRSALAPWVAAARDTARAGVLACGLLADGDGHGAPAPARRSVVAALARSEDRFANVLRGVVPPFVRAVLARSGGAEVAVPAAHEVVVVTGPTPRPGDRDLAERLVAQGHGVHVTSRPEAEPDRIAAAQLVVVGDGTSAAAAAALARVPVPLLAWSRLLTLGLTDRAQVLLARDRIRLADVGHPLAAGHTGAVTVHRGPGKLTWHRPLPGAEVVARTEPEGVAVVTRVPAGVPLVDGTPAPADRVLFFLADDGPAPWLLTPDGRALFDAAVAGLLGRAAARPDAPVADLAGAPAH